MPNKIGKHLGSIGVCHICGEHESKCQECDRQFCMRCIPDFCPSCVTRIKV